MNWPPESKSWEEFIPECLWYLLPGLAFHVIAMLFTFVIYWMLVITPIKLPRIRSIFTFHVCLLGTSMFANGIWSCMIWGNYYWTVDYTSDFSALAPITRSQIAYSWGDSMIGGLNGISLFQLNMIWAGFAIAAWLLAFGFTCRLVRRYH